MTIGIMAFLSSTTAFMTFSLMDEKITDAAEIFAENIADKVTDAILNTYYIKSQYPDLNYSKVIDIPLRLAENKDYYIEINNKNVFVNTTDDKVNVKNTIFNVTKRLGIDINSKKVYGSYGKINISCSSFDYIYKIDFGPVNSPSATGYTRVNNLKQWDTTPGIPDGWKYVIPITITNPIGQDLSDYQVLIKLNESNFDYSHAESDGRDLRFFRTDGELYFWIETWYSRDTHSSRIWVNVTNLPSEGCLIYMFYGNPDAEPLSNNYYHDPEKTFLFFDDFADNNLDYSKWIEYLDNDFSKIIIKNSNLVLSNNAALRSKGSEGYLSHLSENYVIETKVKSTEENVSSYIFAGSDGTNPPYHSGLVFSSAGLSEGDNMTLIRYRGGSWQNLTSDDKPPMKKDVLYRLKYIINDGDNVIARYYYNNFSLDSYASVASPIFDGYFGLCTIKDTGMTHYDWIMVRKYIADTSSDVSSLKEAIPTASVGGMQSDSLGWVFSQGDPLYGDRNGYHKLVNDFIYSTSAQPSTFKIKDLNENLEYSLTIDIGDGDISSDIDCLNIDIKDANGDLIKDFNVTTNLYEKVWVSGIKPQAGVIEIIFDDVHWDLNKCYWAVNSLTLERGKRCINIKGGS